MGIDVRGSNSMSDGRAERAVHDAVKEINEQIGQSAYDRIRQRLRTVLRNPTGYYESRVRTVNTGSTEVITDGGVIYGPWLEGTSSRNGRTRFKGYQTFRRVSQDIEKESSRDAEDIIGAEIGKIK